MRKEKKYFNCFALVILLAGVILFLPSADKIPSSEEHDYILTLDAAALPEYLDEEAFLSGSGLSDSAVCLDAAFPYLLVTPAEGTTDTAMQQTLTALPYVRAIEPNHKIETAAFTSDTYSDRQWSLGDTSYGIDAVNTWKKLKPGSAARSVTVAVIDTGVDYQHPDLANSMWINQGEIPGDGIDNDGNGYVDDIYGWDFYHNDNTVCHYVYDKKTGLDLADPADSDNHGTHVAGIIAASADNGIGIAGAAGKFPVKIMSLKALGGGTDSSPGTGSMFQTIKAIRYATNMGADICNLSWGNTTYSAALEQAIRESNMLFVAAAGNTSSNNNSNPVYPASLPLDNIISVASTDKKGNLAAFSNYGISSVDLAAPGHQITSTIVGTYASMSGTSMAAPHVSAVAAMLYSTSGNLYASGIKDILLTSGRYLPALDGKIRTPVLVNAASAYAGSQFLVPDKKAPEFTWKITYEPADIEVAIRAQDTGGSGIRTIRYIFGKKDLSSFRHGTEGLSAETISSGSDGTTLASAFLAKPGSYTFYASDYAGNETIQVIPVKRIASDKLTLLHSRKTIRTGGTYQLKYKVLPEDHTDPITFTSSDPDILCVDKNGFVTALAKGRAAVEVRTSSGLTAYCYFNVRR